MEAQASGCPVIAYSAGGALESVTPSTGVFFGEQTVEALIDAVAALDRMEIDPVGCRRNAERFSEDNFDRAMIQKALSLLEA